MYNGAFYRRFRTFCSILPGCSCSTGLAKLVVRRDLREVARKHQTVKLSNLVDDLLLRAVGPEETITKEIVEATNGCTGFCRDVALPVVFDNTSFLSSSDRLASERVASTDLLADNRVDGFRFLGGDATTREKGWRRLATLERRNR